MILTKRKCLLQNGKMTDFAQTLGRDHVQGAVLESRLVQ